MWVIFPIVEWDFFCPCLTLGGRAVPSFPNGIFQRCVGYFPYFPNEIFQRCVAYIPYFSYFPNEIFQRCVARLRCPADFASPPHFHLPIFSSLRCVSILPPYIFLLEVRLNFTALHFPAWGAPKVHGKRYHLFIVTWEKMPSVHSTTMGKDAICWDSPVYFKHLDKVTKMPI